MIPSLWRLRRKKSSLSLWVLVLMLLVTLLPTTVLAAPPAAPQASGTIMHTVGYGETLYGIANYYGVSAQAIMNYNSIWDANHIYVGQQLWIPANTSYPQKPQHSTCVAYHPVKGGQTLSSIALYYGVHVSTLAQANGIWNYDHIYKGMKLCIPGTYTPPTPDPKPPHQNDPCNYIVRRGDTVAWIAKWYNTSVYELMRINGLYDPNRIEVGQRLVLPGCYQAPQPYPQHPKPPPPPQHPQYPPQPQCPQQCPPPAPAPQPSPTTYWTAWYYNNTDLSGQPVAVSQNAAINFNWGQGGPVNCNPDNFSVVWSRDEYFRAGNYRFYATADDGVRVYVDGRLVIDAWRIQPSTSYYGDINLSNGYHQLRVEYFEASGMANIAVNWSGM